MTLAMQDPVTRPATKSTTKTTTTKRPVVPPLFERVKKAFAAARILHDDPNRLDQILVFTQAVNAGRIARAAERIESLPGGRAMLEEQRRIDRTHVDYDALARLPDGTLGREYTRFLTKNGITPDAFEALPDVADPRAAWIMLRIRQTHDLWHVLAGYDTDVRGEVLLQMFTYAQLGAPSALMIAIFGTVRHLGPSRALLRDLKIAYRHGKATAFLPTFAWEDHWSTPVATLRQKLSCPDVRDLS